MKARESLHALVTPNNFLFESVNTCKIGHTRNAFKNSYIYVRGFSEM